MPLTKEQIQLNIETLEQQGASQPEIQGWLDSQKIQVPITETETKQPGFIQSMAQGLIGPPAKAVATGLSAIKGAFNLAQAGVAHLRGKEKEQKKEVIEGGKGVNLNLGWLGQYGPQGAGLSVSKQVKLAAGLGAQTAALAIGPVAGGAAFAGGMALEEDKSLGEVAAYTAGGAVLGKAGELAFKGAGTLLKSAGGFMKEVGAGSKALMESAAKEYEKVLAPTTKAMKQITGKVSAGLAELRPIAFRTKGLLSKAEQMVNIVGERLETAWDKLPVKHQTAIKPILKAITDTQDKLAIKKIVPGVNKVLFNTLGKLKQELIDIAGDKNISTRILRDYRQTLDSVIKSSAKGEFTYNPSDKAILKAQKTVANAIRNELGKAAPDIAKINNDFTFWKRVQTVLTATVERKTGQSPPISQTMGKIAGGALGFTHGGVSGGITGTVLISNLQKVISSTAWRTVSASLKSQLAESLAKGEESVAGKILEVMMKGTGTLLEKAGGIIGGVPKAVREWPQNVGNLKGKIGLTIEDVSGKSGFKQGSVPKTVPVFQGFKDLTTKVLERLKGKSTTSRQEIMDFTNMPELKQAERDVIRNVLEAQKGDTIPVQEFTNKVKDELLPLKIKKVGEKDTNGMWLKYENISLPDNLKGNVANYDEHIWESPIKTSAGKIHFESEYSNYFGHTRIEDMANIVNPKWKIEIGLQGEYRVRDLQGKVVSRSFKNKKFAQQFIKEEEKNAGLFKIGNTRRVIEVQSDLYQKGNIDNSVKMFGGIQNKARKAEITKLQQYNDPTAHFRMVREEVKQAALDGKTKLQFPTGETAMKIEGLGGDAIINQWVFSKNPLKELTPDNLKIGEIVFPNRSAGTEWIITDVLGDGKFKAVPKETWNMMKQAEKGKGQLAGADAEHIAQLSETFDISGKVDTNNPIYRFYEKDLGSYLKNKLNAKLITDNKGVTWWEVPIQKQMAKAPVEAFGVLGLPLLNQQKNNSPTVK